MPSGRRTLSVLEQAVRITEKPRDWRQRALCRDPQVNPRMFVADTNVDIVRRKAEVRAAKQLCQACPVQAECLAVALWDVDASGVWGGTTQSERIHLRAEARRMGASKPFWATGVSNLDGLLPEDAPPPRAAARVRRSG